MLVALLTAAVALSVCVTVRVSTVTIVFVDPHPRSPTGSTSCSQNQQASSPLRHEETLSDSEAGLITFYLDRLGVFGFKTPYGLTPQTYGG